MSAINDHVRCALLNRELTHVAFRLYVALAELLEGKDPERPVSLSVERLKSAMPGVRGKPFGEGPLREGLADLQSAGLVIITGPKWSRISLQVSLTRPAKGRESSEILGEIPLKGQVGFD